MRLSKSLPRGLVGLDANWPSAPVALTEASNQLREMYRLHLTRKFMRPLTPEDRAQVREGWGRMGRINLFIFDLGLSQFFYSTTIEQATISIYQYLCIHEVNLHIHS